MGLNLDYQQHPWGDLIAGTPDDLRALGIGAGKPFPGEPGGPRRQLTFTDSRGFAGSVVASSQRPGWCLAKIPFPDQARDPQAPMLLASGVTLARLHWGDRFEGRIEAFIRAGMVHAEELPGALGGSEKTVHIYPDGCLERGRKLCRSARAAQVRVLRLLPGERLEMSVYATREVADARRSEMQQELLHYRRGFLAMTRPESLRGQVKTSTTAAGNVIAFPIRGDRGNERTF